MRPRVQPGGASRRFDAGCGGAWRYTPPLPPGRTAIRLRITQDDKPPVDHELSAAVVVLGRAPDCDVVVDHPYVSKRHLRIVGGVVVEDLGSSNGTFLDDAPLDGPEVWGTRTLTVGGPGIRIEVLLSKQEQESPLNAEVLRLRERVLELEQELALAREEPEVEEAPRVVPAVSGSVPGIAGECESALLEELVREDFKEFPPRMEGTVTDFYILESFRLLRQVEKVVTRMAGELSKQLNLHTVLPDSEGNFMGLIAEVMVRPDDSQPRDDLVEYLNQLRKWLFVALGSYQKASVKFADEMRQALSPMSLAQQAPIPGAYRLFGLEEQVLWKRARAYLDDLSRNYVEDRLDELAREAATELLGGNRR